MTAFLRASNNPLRRTTTYRHSPYILFSTCVVNQMTSKVSKLWYKFAKNVTEKKHSDNLSSNFVPKLYNALSKTCRRKKVICSKNTVSFSRLGPKEKDRIILKCLINKRIVVNNTLNGKRLVMPEDLQCIASISDSIRDSNSIGVC